MADHLGQAFVGFLLPAEPIESFDHYLATEFGGLGIKRAGEIGAEGVLAELEASGLRGRGGAGFPTGRKWRSVASQTEGSRYLVCNAAEGEPSTFKDRALIRANPYQLVEGLFIAALALDATGVYVVLKASSEPEYQRLVTAIAEMQQAGICRDCEVAVVRGPEEYLLGEEKALLEVIEGRAPLPRLFPPFERGLFATDIRTGWENSAGPSSSQRASSNPTAVNNVETLSNVPHIIARGARWFRSFGTAASPGTVVVTVVGDVRRAAVAEVELGTPLRAAIEQISGGAADGHRIKAVLSGASNAVLTEAQLDVPMTYEDLTAIGSGLGAAGLFVVDEHTCMVEVARQFSTFLHVESCGQCPPCKQGAAEITARLDLIEAGRATAATLAELTGWLTKVTDANRCYLGTQEQVVVSAILAGFADEVAEHIELGRCPRPRPVALPKVADLRDGVAFYDQRQARKRPDWTYAEEP